MKILVFGKDGNVGWELQRSLAPLGELILTGRHSAGHCGDLSNPEGIARTIQEVQPDLIVNAAAYTAVDKAESDAQNARLVNAASPAIMAREAQQCGAWLIHYSTDYVFDGSGTTPWRETDGTGPLNVYGKTKLEGEQAIAASGCRYLIFRTSWVHATRGNSFIKTILRLAGERDQLSIIDDQFGAPTGAELLADVTAHCSRRLASSFDGDGIYHLAASGTTSWHEYARLIVERAQLSGRALQTRPEMVRPQPTAAYPTPARRPLNSRLNTEKLRSTFDLVLPDWQLGVLRTLDEILG